MRLAQTPSQTVGPFFALGLLPTGREGPFLALVGPETCAAALPGERIRITGGIYDGDGEPIPDGLVEIWQSDAQGRFAGQGSDPGFGGLARSGTGKDGRFTLTTIKPGSIGAPHAPHIGVIVCMRGLLTHAYTRLYFGDETGANALDPALARVPCARRSTLIAPREETPKGPLYRFDIHMQGPRETVFFDV